MSAHDAERREAPQVDARPASGRRSAAAARPSLSKPALLTFGTNLGVAALSLLSVLITARTLGAHGRGEVAFLTTVGLLAAQLSSLGIEQAISNFAGQDEQLSDRLATNAVILALLTGLAAALVVAILVAVVPAAGGQAPSGLR